jgi:hypothetical protein
MSCIFFVPKRRRQIRGWIRTEKSLHRTNTVLAKDSELCYAISKMEKDYFATISTGIEKSLLEFEVLQHSPSQAWSRDRANPGSRKSQTSDYLRSRDRINPNAWDRTEISRTYQHEVRATYRLRHSTGANID